MRRRVFWVVFCTLGIACGGGTKAPGVDGAAAGDAFAEAGLAGDTGAGSEGGLDQAIPDGKPGVEGGSAPAVEAGIALDGALDAFDPTEACAGSFVACGCGCCGPSPGSGAEIRCYYPGDGDRLSSIMADDLSKRGGPACATVGCTLGTLYQCCLPGAAATPATYSVETYIGGYNRLTIRRVGEDGKCASLLLLSPMREPNTAFRITAPTSFQASEGDFGDCATAGRAPVVGGLGSVILRKSGTGCVLDARFSLFLPTSSGPAASVRFEATGLGVPQIGSSSCPD